MAKLNDIELARYIKMDQGKLCRDIKKKHHALYKNLKLGMKTRYKMETGQISKFKPSYSKALRVFCISHFFSIEVYELLLLAGVKTVDELLDTDYLIGRWDKVKDYA